MSVPTTQVSRSAIEVIAQMMGLKVDPQVATEFARDVEYRIREVIQDSRKFMLHSKRKKLMPVDVNNALRMRNVEPIYGSESSRTVRFGSAAPGLYFVQDPILDLAELTNAGASAVTAAVPVEPSLSMHWLAVQGVQPLIPQNPSPLASDEIDPSDARKRKYRAMEDMNGSASSASSASALSGATPALSVELRAYLDRVIKAVYETDDSLPTVAEKQKARKQALVSLSKDAALQPLIPYLVQSVAHQITKNLGSIRVLYGAIQILDALLRNVNLQVELYLHQMMPCLLTCVLSKSLGSSEADDHWSLRDFASTVVARICNGYSVAYPTLTPKTTKTLLGTILDKSKPLATQYGAIVCMEKIGPSVTRSLLLEPFPNSNLSVFAQVCVLPNLQSRDVATRTGANKCQGALLRIAQSFVAEMSQAVRMSSTPAMLIASASSSAAPAASSNGMEIDSIGAQAEPAAAAASSSSAADAMGEQILKQRFADFVLLPQFARERYQELAEVFGEESLLPASTSGQPDFPMAPSVPSAAATSALAASLSSASISAPAASPSVITPPSSSSPSISLPPLPAVAPAAPAQVAPAPALNARASSPVGGGSSPAAATTPSSTKKKLSTSSNTKSQAQLLAAIRSTTKK